VSINSEEKLLVLLTKESPNCHCIARYTVSAFRCDEAEAGTSESLVTFIGAVYPFAKHTWLLKERPVQ
jgi:hypothetical protein